MVKIRAGTEAEHREMMEELKIANRKMEEMYLFPGMIQNRLKMVVYKECQIFSDNTEIN